MKEVSKNYIDQYKLLFYASWIILYFIFPSWYFPQIYFSFANKIITLPPWIYQPGLLTYFFISAYLLNYFFKTMFIDKPLIIHSNDWSEHVGNNLWLVIICCIAAVLHIFSYSLFIAASAYSLWIYRFINSHWHKLFDFPIQYPIWIFLFFLILILKQKKLVNFISSHLNSAYSAYKSNYSIKLLFMVFIVGIFILYTHLLPSYHWRDHLFISGYPPLGTILHLIIYSLFGTGNIYLPSVIVQFTFYILSGVFLYRAINLFCEKETALLGSSIYLFSPLVFSYATVGHLGSGTVFFIISVSYFFLKFIRDGEDHDLVLTTFFMSIGCLYKRVIILLFFICSAYLIVRKIKQKDLRLLRSLKVLSIAPISFLPWYFIGTRGADNMVWSNLTSPDSLFSALLMVLSQLSWPVFLLFMLSIIYALYKRDHLSVFFGIVFIVYYVLFTTVRQQTVHRYAMAFHPTISVFLALFIHGVLQKIRWKHAFKVVFSVLIIYLAILCIIPRSSTTLITFKYTDFENQKFPVEEALEWILNETGDDERVLIFGVTEKHKFYAGKKGIDPEKIYPAHFRSLSYSSSSDKYKSFSRNLKELCEKQKISYILFRAYSDRISSPSYNYMFREKGFIKNVIINSKNNERIMRKFLKENKYDDFKEFSIDDNYIYIYKLRDDVGFDDIRNNL